MRGHCGALTVYFHWPDLGSCATPRGQSLPWSRVWFLQAWTQLIAAVHPEEIVKVNLIRDAQVGMAVHAFNFNTQEAGEWF